jgi:hypothetical protein
MKYPNRVSFCATDEMLKFIDSSARREQDVTERPFSRTDWLRKTINEKMKK